MWDEIRLIRSPASLPLPLLPSVASVTFTVALLPKVVLVLGFTNPPPFRWNRAKSIKLTDQAGLMWWVQTAGGPVGVMLSGCINEFLKSFGLIKAPASHRSFTWLPQRADMLHHTTNHLTSCPLCSSAFIFCIATFLHLCDCCGHILLIGSVWCLSTEHNMGF